MEKPLWTLQCDTIACGFELRVNNIPLFTEKKGKSLNVEFPLNHYLNYGKNKIDCLLSPASMHKEYVKHTKSEFKIFIREIEDFKTNRKQIGQFLFPDYINNQALKKSPIPLTCFLEIELPFEDPLWINGMDLDINNIKIMDEINAIYKNYYLALKEKNLNLILDLNELKIKHYASCYYKGTDIQRNETKNSFINVWDIPDNVLVEFDIQKIFPFLYANNKLITFFNNENRSPLMYYNTDTGITTTFEIFIFKNSKPFSIIF